MASEDKNYTSEFKREVAQKALDQQKQDLDKLSDKYELPVSVILMWATELENAIDNNADLDEVFASEEEAEEATEAPQEVDIEADDRVAESVAHGVMDDKLNYKRLVFWSVLGTILVIIFVKALLEMYQLNERQLKDSVSADSEYYQVNKMNREAEEELNSFGVVDAENDVYRIPIDSAINKVAADK
ncbi:hypothetical protein [Fodinibius halophilus]|uniref:Transposase n=1 Tax=Fodinibius halophilus TaxID=1736908 RepID=A0A6M1T4S8_9BACT|nr:hypothetical protein [Fodinibius halophilus]NGP88255.1 hypothetical protein [Fodinibius halophilus]